jgi:hypothetical protein
MVSGEINPGQLHIVREILYSDRADPTLPVAPGAAAKAIDTAVYNGNFAPTTP